MIAPANRMKSMRNRRRDHGLRELRLVVPDLRSASVRARIAAGAVGLDVNAEAEAMAWIESVSEFDTKVGPEDDEAR